MKSLFIALVLVLLILSCLCFGPGLELPVMEFLLIWAGGSLPLGFLVAVLRFLFLPVHNEN